MASSRWPSMSCLLYDVNGCKDVLGLWIGGRRASMPGCRSSSTKLRARGVKDLGILSMDGVSGLEEAPGCIPACHGSALHRTPHPQFHPLHPTAVQWSAFTKRLKLIYGAINVKQARQEFEKFKTDWQAWKHPGAVSVWENNFSRPSGSITMAVPCARCIHDQCHRASTLTSAR